MPWGKHAGAELGAIPTDYLRFVLDCEGTRPGLAADVRAVLAWRET